MNIETWQEQNSRYLSASLGWLRFKLRQLAETAGVGHDPMPGSRVLVGGEEAASLAEANAPPVPAAEPPESRRSRCGWPFRRNDDAETAIRPPAPSPADTLPAHTEMDYARLVADAEAARSSTALGAETPPALILLADALKLTEFERDTLLLCVAMELDTGIANLCARAQGDANRPYPTFSLALALFADAAWDALAPHRPLRYWRLVEINQPGATPLTVSALRADERITNYVKGLNVLDDRLANLLTEFWGEAALSGSQVDTAGEILWHWRRTSPGSPSSVAQLLGADSSSKRLIAHDTASGAGRQLYGILVDELPVASGDLDLFIRLWQRESQLLPLALYIDAQSQDSPESQRSLDRFLTHAAESNSLLFLAVREALPELAAGSFTVDVSKPTLAEQRDAWQEELGDAAVADALASQFNFDLPEVVAIAHQADPDHPESVWEVARSRTRPRLDTLAQRLNPKATWEQLVVPEEPGRLLHEIANQVRHRAVVYEDWGFSRRMNRGLGISALFAGESGTGKTMAAEVIANELKLDLYRIDLSAVVSKYIGETEKNLRRLFDAAEDGGAILFFDEADALFGKRSEVKDSHDRYANIEINYLLQRMEAYGGLAILATNMKSALDTAFMRRIRFIVNFPFPGPAERQKIWERVFPPEAVIVDEEYLTKARAAAGRGEMSPAELARWEAERVDFARLARLNLTGGSIQIVALAAAFMAAHAHSPVTMSLLLAAARSEFRKLDRPINESDFRPPAVPLKPVGAKELA